MSDYWELKKEVRRIFPQVGRLDSSIINRPHVKNRRRSNLRQFDILNQGFVEKKNVAKNDNLERFIEISVGAPECAMCLNIDVYDSIKCPHKCLYCFPSGTKILMNDGSEKNIENICVGDRIMSYNENTGDPEIAIVQEKLCKITKGGFITIELNDGRSLRMTEEHPIFIKGKGWVKARDIKEDDEVLTW